MTLPCGRLRMTRGQRGWPFLRCRALSFPTHNRFKLVAHSKRKGCAAASITAQMSSAQPLPPSPALVAGYLLQRPIRADTAKLSWPTSGAPP
jgi:hypothetical protein